LFLKRVEQKVDIFLNKQAVWRKKIKKSLPVSPSSSKGGAWGGFLLEILYFFCHYHTKNTIFFLPLQPYFIPYFIVKFQNISL
jgi:hypothetical protein